MYGLYEQGVVQPVQVLHTLQPLPRVEAEVVQQLPAPATITITASSQSRPWTHLCSANCRLTSALVLASARSLVRRGHAVWSDESSASSAWIELNISTIYLFTTLAWATVCTGTGCQARAGFHSLSEPGRGGYSPASWAWTQGAGCSSSSAGYRGSPGPTSASCPRPCSSPAPPSRCSPRPAAARPRTWRTCQHYNTTRVHTRGTRHLARSHWPRW